MSELGASPMDVTRADCVWCFDALTVRTKDGVEPCIRCQSPLYLTAARIIRPRDSFRALGPRRRPLRW